MKKLLSIILLSLAVLTLTACGNKNIEGTLPEIMDKLYEGIDEDNLPMALTTTELTSDNFEYYAFTDKIKYKEAVVSESLNGSIAHSVVLIRLESAGNSKEVVEELKEKANPRKWICVEAENTYVLSKGDLVVLIMSNEIASKIKENFESLK